MTGALAALVGVYVVVIFAGKHSRRLSVGGIVFLMGAAALQVAVVLYLTYIAKIPLPQ
jgi:hypothetical protein